MHFVYQVRHVFGRRVLADAVAEVEDVAHTPALALPGIRRAEDVEHGTG